jgi:hypothetical protein
MPPPPPPPPTPSAHDAALAEVARLTAVADANPLLAAWTGRDGGVPPFDRLAAAALPAALETGVALRGAELEAIVTDPAPATFANTIAALEGAGRHLHRAETLFGVMASGLNSPDVQAVEEQWSPKLAAAADQQINFNQALFARIAAVHADRATAGLDPVQVRLVEKYYDGMVRRGAKLDADGKAKLGAVNQELAGLYTGFGNKVLADEDTWIVLEKKEDLAGLSADRSPATPPPPRSTSCPASGPWSTPARASIRSWRRRRGATCASGSGRRSRAAAITATPTTPRRRSRGSSSCAPSAPRCWATPPTPTCAWTTRWPRIRPRRWR